MIVNSPCCRELDLEDALRLHAVSTFWARVVSRDHPVAGFLAKQLLPRLATLATGATEDEEESCDDDEAKGDEEGEEEAEPIKVMEVEVEGQEEVESGEKELIDEELAWLTQDNEKTTVVEQTEKADDDTNEPVEPMNTEPTGEAAPPDMNEAMNDWSLLQEVAIAARARLHELEIRTASYWREGDSVAAAAAAAGGEDDEGNGDAVLSSSFTSHNALRRGDYADVNENEDEDEEDEEGIKGVKGPFPEATEQPLDPTEALSLATEVRASPISFLWRAHTKPYPGTWTLCSECMYERLPCRWPTSTPSG
jgi:hypothetical protein